VKDVQIRTFRATFNTLGSRADNPQNVSLLGTPVSVTVPTRDGGSRTEAGVIVEIGDDVTTIEFFDDREEA